MAKKANTAVKDVEVATQTIEKPITKNTQQPKKPSWEIKDRTYTLLGHHSPITYTIPARHSAKYPLLWFDEESGEQKELRYATNQNSVFVQDQKGEATLGHIIFHNGTLSVGKQNQNLQKMLSLYHPTKNVKYKEFDPVEIAHDELDDLVITIEALNMAREMDIDIAEAVLRVEIGSRVSEMSSKEIRRDLILFAQRNAELFIDLANDDNVQLRNLAINATEAGIISLSQDQRTFNWASNNRKLINVPFDENPYSAMAAFFKTDEGVEIYKSIEKKLS
jgi:hypothetical protein